MDPLACVTTAEDKDLEAEALCDMRSTHLALSETKMSNALKHADIFLASHCKKITTPRISCRHLTCYGVKTSGTIEEANMWWDDMMQHPDLPTIGYT